MRFMNLYANKMLEDVVAYTVVSGSKPTQQLKDWVGYVKYGSANVADAKPSLSRNDTSKSDSNTYISAPRDVGKVERFAARGARAGYLVGCALTSTTDLFFGTPETTCQTPRQPKSRLAHDGIRVGYGLFRPKPPFDTVELHEGLIGTLYTRVGCIVQWLGGNAGALVGAANYTVSKGVTYGARWLGHALFAQYVDAAIPLSRLAFARDVKRAAQKADVIGTVVFGFPLYLTFGLAIGGAVLVSAILKGVSTGIGALVGTLVAGIDNLCRGDTHITEARKSVWLAMRAGTRAMKNDIVDVLDSKAGLHEAMLAAAKREINLDDVEDVLQLHHGDED